MLSSRRVISEGWLHSTGQWYDNRHRSDSYSSVVQRRQWITFCQKMSHEFSDQGQLAVNADQQCINCRHIILGAWFFKYSSRYSAWNETWNISLNSPQTSNDTFQFHLHVSAHARNHSFWFKFRPVAEVHMTMIMHESSACKQGYRDWHERTPFGQTYWGTEGLYETTLECS